MFFCNALKLLGCYLTLMLFGASGLVFNLFCLAAGLVPATDRTQRFFQRLIHRHFACFVWWLRFSRICRVSYHGFDRAPQGAIVVAANHPGLMDITYLLARVPEAVCIFKRSIGRNPVLGAAAHRAGYLANEGVDLVRRAVRKVSAGHTLIVFPEGTRTPPGSDLLPLKAGFVLIARRASAPIQLVRITWNSNILAKGHPWWKLPRIPARVEVTMGPRIDVPDGVRPSTVAADIEAWFRGSSPAGAGAMVVTDPVRSPPAS